MALIFDDIDQSSQQLIDTNLNLIHKTRNEETEVKAII